MLELKNLVKSYSTAGFTQKALDDVSVTLRDNEFVAVLGPSGSGKTTLLNIVGGLDHYDSGDLVIDGISTKMYKDRDWDTYRNNRIGFVFQSYNLIPHQSVLSNVELALTLSGVPKEERRDRAKAALARVGLEEHVSKKPSQLSGGQMQRVAIARALINDPEILLADEPTGALDSKTSVQIMDLLKEIAADRLVVMVTHNPELADEYANRTIKLSDGKVVGDTNPVLDEEERHEGRPPRKAKMSFLTAIALSFSNLMTKKGRTLMMAFAGSIGIIGIAAILALSNGVNNYIKTVEEDTLSVYPLTINSTGFDMTSMLMGSAMGGTEEEEESESGESATGIATVAVDAGEGDDRIKEMGVISTMFDQVQSNDLEALKNYMESSECDIDDYVNTIQYSYDVLPQIYLPETDPEVHQVNPDTSFSALGLGSGMSSSSMMSMGMSTNVFSQLLDDVDIYSEQYEIVAGDWPSSSDELVLVLGSANRISDFLLYPMGLRDHKDLSRMVEAFINEEPVDVPEGTLSFTHEDLMAVEFSLVYNSDFFTYDKSYEVWVDRRDDEEYVKKLVENGKTLKISGIITAKEDSDTMVLGPGIYYTSGLVEEIIAHSEKSEVTKFQQKNPALNIFTNNTFVDEANKDATSDFDMSSMFSIDEEAMGDAFGMDESALSGMDFGGLIDPYAVMASTPMPDIASALGGVSMTSGIDVAALQTAIQGAVSAAAAGAASSLSDGYIDYALANPGASFNDYVNDPAGDAQSRIDAIMGPAAGSVSGLVNIDAQMAQYQADMAYVIQGVMSEYMTAVLTNMSTQLTWGLQAAMDNLMYSMADAMSIDQDAFMNAFQFNLDEAELTALMMSMMGGQESSLDGNLRRLGYANFDNPSQISIYPIDFESKQAVLDILDSYNKRMEDAGNVDQVISYTDIVGTLMSSVTEIIDMISMVLVAFVAISLVVSSIMIGIITYISVLERKKEIGILRSIGASKRDIGNVFNAETLIVGLVAGIMGIGIVLLLSIPANIIIMEGFGIPNLVLLPPEAGLILIGVSCVLTFMAGLMPSSAASNKDPVEALRSE